MPVLRNGARRGRRGKKQKEEGREEKAAEEQQQQPKIQIQEQGIATRTRRRRAAAAAAAVAEEAPVAADENLVVAVPGVPEAEAREIREEAVAGQEREENVEKPMDDYESGGKSNDKGNAADDEGMNGPIPERVLLHICCSMHLNNFICWLQCVACMEMLDKDAVLEQKGSVDYQNLRRISPSLRESLYFSDLLAHSVVERQNLARI